MPHLYVEYSANLADFPERQLLTELNAAVCGHPTVADPLDVKSRIASVQQFVIGTTPGLNGFVHAQLHLLSGRTPEVKKELSDRIADVLRRLTPQPAGMLVQLSVDIVDMERSCYYKGRL